MPARTRSLLLGMLWGATATTLLGLLLIRPVRVVFDAAPSAPISQRGAELPDGTDGTQSVPNGLDRAANSGEIEPGEQRETTLPVTDTQTNAAPTDLTQIDPAQVNPSTGVSNLAGSLSVSNQTAHAVRVALLSQSPLETSPTALTNSDQVAGEGTGQLTFDEPVHWDFAPGEGNLKGLRLSLPDGRQTIQAGDVLMAFAQDGSQRYWGPYVVGVTPLPVWQNDANEWQLTLQIPTSPQPKS
ncbi:MAG: hypothetical protein ACFB4J_12030 [Elainellaceae cyanobacterium]